MIRTTAILLAAIATATLPSTAAAQRGKHGPPAAAAAQRAKHEPAAAAAHQSEHAQAAAPGGFTTAERDAIAGYFKNHPMAAKPLPPGIARNLQRGKPLPRGIAKRQLPAPLLQHLPARTGANAHAKIAIVGDRVVLLDASGVVVDILSGVLGK